MTFWAYAIKRVSIDDSDKSIIRISGDSMRNDAKPHRTWRLLRFFFLGSFRKCFVFFVADVALKLTPKMICDVSERYSRSCEYVTSTRISPSKSFWSHVLLAPSPPHRPKSSPHFAAATAVAAVANQPFLNFSPHIIWCWYFPYIIQSQYISTCNERQYMRRWRAEYVSDRRRNERGLRLPPGDDYDPHPQRQHHHLQLRLPPTTLHHLLLLPIDLVDTPRLHPLPLLGPHVKTTHNNITISKNTNELPSSWKRHESWSMRHLPYLVTMPIYGESCQRQKTKMTMARKWH